MSRACKVDRARLDPVVVASAVICVGLLLWSMREVVADPAYRLYGNRVDSQYAAWALWWKASGEIEGQLSRMVSFPGGEVGSVLVPIGSYLVRPLVNLVSAVAAHNVLTLLYLVLDVVAVATLTTVWTRSTRAGGVAAVALLVGRPLIAQGALGNPEGAALAPMVLALAAGLRWGQGRPDWLWGLLVGGLLAVSVIENPYTIAPGVCLAVGLAYRRLRGRKGAIVQLLLACVGGVWPVWFRLVELGGSVHGHTTPHNRLELLGWSLPMYDTASFQATAFVVPSAPPEFFGPTGLLMASGDLLYLGMVPVGLALASLHRRAWPWVVFFAACLLTAAGSEPVGGTGIPGPFWFMNVVLEATLSPLTQPYRYAAVACVPLAVLAGMGALRLTRERGPRVWVVLLGGLALEALFLGGPAMRVGMVDTRGMACVGGAPDGPVHTVMADASGGGQYAGDAMLLQLYHGQPGTHSGLGGEWTAAKRNPDLDRSFDILDRCVFGSKRDGTCLYSVGRVESVGVRWVLAPVSGQDHLPAPVAACDDWSLYELNALKSAFRNLPR